MIISLFAVPALLLLGFLFMQQKAFGQLPKNDRLRRVELSPNYKDGKFQNIEETPVMAEDASFFKLMKEFFKEHPNTAPTESIPSIHSNLKTQITDSVAVYWFGHSSYLLKLMGKNILVDPVFSKRASPVSFAGVESFAGTMPFTTDDLPFIDAMVITHDHYDHMDYPTIMKIQSKTGIYIVPLGVGQHLQRWGIPVNKIIELDWWEDATIFPEIKITATPARHFSGRGLVRNKTLWASFVLSSPKCKLFIGGDSGYGKHYAEIGEKFGPFDLVFLESGQYNKMWANIHMMPEETVQAAVDLKAQVLMPVHWGKFKLAMHPWNEPIKRVMKRAEELGVAVATPMLGETMVLNNLPINKPWVDGFRQEANKVTVPEKELVEAN